MAARSPAEGWAAWGEPAFTTQSAAVHALAGHEVSDVIDWIETALNEGRNWPDRLYELKRLNLAASPILAAL
jgi:hypothetical protein